MRYGWLGWIVACSVLDSISACFQSSGLLFDSCPVSLVFFPRGLMVRAVDFWIHWLMRTWVQTPVLELNWSELEAVVAGEGGHCVGKGPPSCLVYATVCPSQTPPGRVDKEKYGEKQQGLERCWRRSLSTSDCSCTYCKALRYCV